MIDLPQIHAELTPLAIYGITVLYCFVGAIIPIFNTEAYLIAAAVFLGAELRLPLILLAAFGQMLGKGLIFYSGRGLIHLPLRKYDDKLEKIRIRFEKWENKPDIFLASSALISIPPFYFVSIFYGMLKYSYFRYMLVGFLGFALRFGLISFIPGLAEKLF